VQGQRSAGEQDNVEREQGDKGVQEISGGSACVRANMSAPSLIVRQRLTSEDAGE
jgi:hypothetical protein